MDSKFTVWTSSLQFSFCLLIPLSGAPKDLRIERLTRELIPKKPNFHELLLFFLFSLFPHII